MSNTGRLRVSDIVIRKRNICEDRKLKFTLMNIQTHKLQFCRRQDQEKMFFSVKHSLVPRNGFVATKKMTKKNRTQSAPLPKTNDTIKKDDKTFHNEDETLQNEESTFQRTKSCLEVREKSKHKKSTSSIDYEDFNLKVKNLFLDVNLTNTTISTQRKTVGFAGKSSWISKNQPKQHFYSNGNLEERCQKQNLEELEISDVNEDDNSDVFVDDEAEKNDSGIKLIDNKEIKNVVTYSNTAKALTLPTKLLKKRNSSASKIDYSNKTNEARENLKSDFEISPKLNLLSKDKSISYRKQQLKGDIECQKTKLQLATTYVLNNPPKMTLQEILSKRKAQHNETQNKTFFDLETIKDKPVTEKERWQKTIAEIIHKPSKEMKSKADINHEKEKVRERWVKHYTDMKQHRVHILKSKLQEDAAVHGMTFVKFLPRTRQAGFIKDAQHHRNYQFL